MKLRKKIMLGLCTLMLLAVTFTSTTYAWFKLNSHADVSFNFQVNGGLGFLISVDNENFSSDITKDQLLMAYYHKTHEKKEEIDGKNVTTNSTEWENGILIDSNTKQEIKLDELEKEFSNIQLYPVTSKDGVNFTDLYNSTFPISSQRYLEFDLYVRAASRNTNDNFTYEISLLYDDLKDDLTGEKTDSTSITSNKAYIDLVSGMDTWKKDAIRTKEGTDTKQVLVNSSNAMRLSIQAYDNIIEDIKNEKGEKIGETITDIIPQETAKIYELTDDETDLGSYATDYSGDDEAESNLYNANLNAMFTYYNNRRPNSKLTPMSYNVKPITFRNSDLINNDDGSKNSNNPVITTVKSGDYSQKLTIRIWQEGWDADCFDGLAESINVRLSFQSFLIDTNDNENKNNN